jgi:hypothetical protein
MATQVKPFEKIITLGYMVLCDGDDGIEPEGVVYFDSPPKLGDTAVLSDKKLWKVTRESNERMEILMELVQ